MSGRETPTRTERWLVAGAFLTSCVVAGLLLFALASRSFVVALVVFGLVLVALLALTMKGEP